MSTKATRKAKPKPVSEKGKKTKARVTRTKRKPSKKTPATPEVKKAQIEVKPEPEKPVEEVKIVEEKKPLVEAKTEVEAPPEIRLPVVEQPELVQVKVEPRPEVKAVEPRTIIEVPEAPEVKPVEVQKTVVTKPELKKPEIKYEVKKPAAAKPLPRPIPKKKLPEPPKESLLLIIRLRGVYGVPYYIERSLQSLRLTHKFNAILTKNNPSMLGTLRQVKDYVTWGDVKSADIARLLKERGLLMGETRVTDKFAEEAFAKDSVDSLAKAISSGEITLKTLWQKGVKPVFRLHPPSGGFESTIKRAYTNNGQLGYRGAAIATLMTDMT